MAKYLRYIAYDCTDADGRPDAELRVVLNRAHQVWPLCWMYEHYATPARTDGVAKVNVFFTAEELDRPPGEVLEIALVYQHFDGPRFVDLPPREQSEYFVERLHDALMRCAAEFGWEATPLVNARQQILDEDFRFTFFWKKPLASPDRRHKVQAWIDATSFPTHLYLVFFDRQMQEAGRTLLSVGTNGPGSVEFALGKIAWLDAETVEVRHQNGRDYWLCSIDGQVGFHYPRAEAGDPHGLYDLGRMYFDGQWVLQNRERGLQLIQAAAEQGFKHATRFLAALK